MKLLPADKVLSEQGGKWIASVFDRDGNYIGNISFRWENYHEPIPADKEGWFLVTGEELLTAALAEAKELYGKKAKKVTILLPTNHRI